MCTKTLVLLVTLVAYIKIQQVSTTVNHNEEHFNSTQATQLDEYEDAEETQHTYCKIATEQLQATANATITRELRGVCTSKELKRSISAILREIQSLKDTLASQLHVAKRTIMRHKRKNLLNLFAVGDTNITNNEPTTNPKIEGRYSYYWVINDVEQYLFEGMSLKSPIITFQENQHYLRLTIANGIVSVRLLNKEHIEVSFIIFVLARSGSKDLRLDSTNGYSVTLRRLRQFKQDGAIYIKLVIE